MRGFRLGTAVGAGSAFAADAGCASRSARAVRLTFEESRRYHQHPTVAANRLLLGVRQLGGRHVIGQRALAGLWVDEIDVRALSFK